MACLPARTRRRRGSAAQGRKPRCRSPAQWRACPQGPDSESDSESSRCLLFGARNSRLSSPRRAAATARQHKPRAAPRPMPQGVPAHCRRRTARNACAPHNACKRGRHGGRSAARPHVREHAPPTTTTTVPPLPAGLSGLRPAPSRSAAPDPAAAGPARARFRKGRGRGPLRRGMGRGSRSCARGPCAAQPHTSPCAALPPLPQRRVCRGPAAPSLARRTLGPHFLTLS